MSEIYMTYREVSSILGASEMTIRRWVGQGLLHPVKLGPKLVRFTVSDVEAFIARGRSTAPAAAELVCV